MEWPRKGKRAAPNFEEIEVVDWAVADILRKKTGIERMELAARAWDAARKVIEQSERLRDPGASELQLRERVARRMRHDPA